jgi:arabinofuranosyltransferase
MAYFASLVPNTGLVKSATSLWLSQGITYLTNFFNPYWLWIPVALLVLTQVDHLVQLRHEQRRAILAAAPLLGGLVSMAYFVAIGGDFMHGRLLLPGLFCLVMNTAIEVNSLRLGAVVAGIVVWSVVCASALRWSVPTVLVVSINDERTVTVGLSDVAHPITPHDFARSQWFGYGQQLRRGAEAYAPKHDGLVLGSNTKLFVALPDRLPPVVGGRNGLGNVLIAATRPIGQVGFAAGQHVYLFDQLSLANPVSSHFIVHERGKPGHEKVASMAWYLGRFGTPGDAAQLNRYRKFSDFERVTSTDVVAARAALSCGPLRRYLRGITAPLTPKLLISNFLHSLSNTTMKFDANPVIARSELCGHN